MLEIILAALTAAGIMLLIRAAEGLENKKIDGDDTVHVVFYLLKGCVHCERLKPGLDVVFRYFENMKIYLANNNMEEKKELKIALHKLGKVDHIQYYPSMQYVYKSRISKPILCGAYVNDIDGLIQDIIFKADQIYSNETSR